MIPVKKFKLDLPHLEEVAKVLQDSMKDHFGNVTVDVVNCPNLMEKPFMLAAEGLCGRTALADVGGVPYLVPLAQKDKCYNLKDVARHAEINDSFIIGAGAGPCHYVGTNCEMMANIKFGEGEVNNTHIAKLRVDGSHSLEKLEGNTDFCLLGNLFVSEGKPGKVLRIQASRRTSADNFVGIIRKILASHYGSKPVGVGGVFLLNKGKAKIHIMPDFSESPLNTDDDVNKWLKFFNMNAPLICLSCFISSDPGLDLRVEHTHCFSDHGEGGHYHTDTTPEEVEYLAYFNLAESIIRVDPPKITHQIGRD